MTRDSAGATAPRDAGLGWIGPRLPGHAAAMLVRREAVPMHGAIGYADGPDSGLFTRKAMTVGNEIGSALAHRRRFADLDDDWTERWTTGPANGRRRTP